MPYAAVEEKLKTIPEEYMGEIYDYLEQFSIRILQKKGIPSKAPVRKLGTLKGKITLHSDFDAPVEDFAEYM